MDILKIDELNKLKDDIMDKSESSEKDSYTLLSPDVLKGRINKEKSIKEERPIIENNLSILKASEEFLDSSWSEEMGTFPPINIAKLSEVNINNISILDTLYDMKNTYGISIDNIVDDISKFLDDSDIKERYKVTIERRK